jgi:hypothetical protein
MDGGDRWTFAVPVIRACRVNRPIEVKHLAPTTYTAKRARVIAARGEIMTPEEIHNALGLPVSQVSVFGEQPVTESELPEFTLQSVFRPSRGINPAFGARPGEYEKIIIKVGYSRDPPRRRDDLNAAFPPAGRLRWTLVYTSRAFADGQSAKDAEDEMKARFDRQFESLGGEFYLGKENDLASAFFSAVTPAAFRITGTAR